MPRFKVDHLVDEFFVAECGFDPFVGFFVEVFDVRRTKPKLIYDKLQASYAHKRPLHGALMFLEREGFIVCLDEALDAIVINADEHDLESAVARTMGIVGEFKAAAD